MSTATSDGNWFIDLLEDASILDGGVGSLVTLVAPGDHRKLQGYVVSTDIAPALGHCLLHNDFAVGEDEAMAFLCQIFDTFRGELLQIGGGGSVYLNRQQWLTWLDYMYPAQAEKIESQLLVQITEIP